LLFGLRMLFLTFAVASVARAEIVLPPPPPSPSLPPATVAPAQDAAPPAGIAKPAAPAPPAAIAKPKPVKVNRRPRRGRKTRTPVAAAPAPEKPPAVTLVPALVPAVVQVKVTKPTQDALANEATARDAFRKGVDAFQKNNSTSPPLS